MSDDRPPCYHEGDTLVIRASSLGGPICQLVASGLGNDILPPPKWLQTAFDAGNYWEGPVLEELRRRGWREPKMGHFSEGAEWAGDTTPAQMEHDWSPVPGIVIRFHPDDVLIPVGDGVPTSRQVDGFPEGPVLVEAKALSAANYEAATGMNGSAADLPYAYDWQLSAMMLGLGLPAVWVTVNKGRAVPREEVLRSLHAEFVARPPIPKAAIVRRCLEVRKHIRSGQLPTADADHQANPCRFLYLCPKVDEQQATVHLSGERGEDLARWAQWYEQQKQVEKLAAERKQEARERLLELVGEDETVAAGGWVVKRTVGDRKGYEVKAKEGVVTLKVSRG